MKRRCEDCGADISHRYVQAIVCVTCSGLRNRERSRAAMKKKTQPSRQPVIVRPGKPGSLFPIANGFKALIRVDGNEREKRFGTREEAETWLDEVARCRAL